MLFLFFDFTPLYGLDQRKSLWTLILTTIVVKITEKPKKKAFSVPPELRINHDMGVVAPPKSAKNSKGQIAGT